MKRKSGSSAADKVVVTRQSADPVEAEWPPVQTALRLPRGLYERLKLGVGERGLGKEIRRRLEISFTVERGTDQETRQLTAAIARIADDVTDCFGAWHVDAFAFQAFQVAVDTLLRHWQPKVDPVKKPNPASLADVLFPPDATAQSIGRTFAGIALHDLQKSNAEKK